MGLLLINIIIDNCKSDKGALHFILITVYYVVVQLGKACVTQVLNFFFILLCPFQYAMNEVFVALSITINKNRFLMG